MTPEEVEARFQRIEAILLNNDETTQKNTEAIRANAEAIKANSQMIQANAEAIRAMQDNADLLLLSLDRLTEASINFERWKRENDLRFNTILQEIRAMNRRITRLENQ